MVGQIDISPDGSCLMISFPYRPDLVEVVKTIPGRRWDRGSRTWKVPIAEVELCVKTFMAHGFRLSPDVATALASGGESKDLGTMQLGKVDQEAPALTISALNLRVAEVLSQNFKEAVWIVGEIAGFKPRGRGRHRYFELVEREAEEDDSLDGQGKARAVVEAVIFESSMAVINRRLRTATQRFALEDGLKVRVRGKVDLYQPRGKYQFLIEDIDPNYTLGELLVRREKILTELTKLGLREKNAELAMPRVPLRIALITSFESEAYNDFVQTLAGSGFAFDITVYDVFVQGDRLQASVLEALETFAEAEDDYDLMVITRGGGSRSELGAWDDLEVAKAIAQHPLKALIGIGHERDQCVLDMIAQSVKTPTAAAELLLEAARTYQEQVEDAMLEIGERAQRILREELRELRRTAESLRQSVRAGLAGAHGDLREGRALLTRSALRNLGNARERVARCGGEIERAVSHRIDKQRFVLEAAATRLSTGSRHHVERATDRIELSHRRIHAVDPRTVLRRGFAILRSNGKALRSVATARRGATLEAQLHDGRLDLEVSRIKKQTRTQDTDN